VVHEIIPGRTNLTRLERNDAVRFPDPFTKLFQAFLEGKFLVGVFLCHRHQYITSALEYRGVTPR